MELNSLNNIISLCEKLPYNAVTEAYAYNYYY